jgi:hypothetical protein
MVGAEKSAVARFVCGSPHSAEMGINGSGCESAFEMNITNVRKNPDEILLRRPAYP